MAVDIRFFIYSHLLEPLKQYPTVIQDTMIELITEKLQLLYDYTYQYPEIISPSQNRIDILKAIADQFLFTIREDADLQEQVDILDHILEVYSKRGSIDTIENMWKYYGGNLPKDIEVKIPSYNLFRYSMSKLSGTHVFQDNTVNRTGVYEIKLTNNTYPIPELRDFLIKELVAAGNYFYFTNTLHIDILNSDPSSNAYKYLVNTENLLQIQLSALKSHQGFTWSGINPLSPYSKDNTTDNYDTQWSGKGSIFLEITRLLEIEKLNFTSDMLIDDLGVLITRYHSSDDIESSITELGDGKIAYHTITSVNSTMNNSATSWITHIIDLYCTPIDSSVFSENHLFYDESQSESPEDDEEIVYSNYPGYFVLGETLLGEEIMKFVNR